MKTIAVIRSIAKALMWSVIVMVALVAVLAAINAVDEDLKPQAAATLQWIAPEVPVAENGFFMIVGVGAESGQDPHAAGVRWVEQINSAKTPQDIEQADSVLMRQQLRFAGDAKLLCPYYSAKSCLDLIADNQAPVRGMQEVNQEWLARYERVQGYQRFATAYAYPSGHTMPHLWQYSRAQRLYLAGIALQVLEGRSREALDRLVRDIGTQRRVLLGCTDLTTKLFAAD
jgi:predicted flap endonuclease-1-like 5' DNA nuclease